MTNRLSPIEISLSQATLRYRPGGPAAIFEVSVVNGSDLFATFLLDLDAPGADPSADYRWYQLSPEVGAKKPPGDRTTFRVSIINSPVPGFVGTMNLTVRIFSLELQAEERQLVRLVVEPGVETAPLEIFLPVSSFSVHPADLLEIPVVLRNPSPVPVEATLQWTGLPPSWSVTPFNEISHPIGLRGQATLDSPPSPSTGGTGDSKPPGFKGFREPDSKSPSIGGFRGPTSNPATKQPTARIRIGPGEAIDTFLQCQVPPLAEVPSQTYPFTVSALQTSGLSSSAQGSFYVLPEGHFEVAFAPTEQDVPDGEGDRLTAEFGVTATNCSNLAQPVSLEVEAKTLPDSALVLPEAVPLPPGASAHLPLAVTPPRPWLGPPRRHGLTVTAHLAEPKLNVQNETQTLDLWVKPRIPFLLQVAAGLLLVAALLTPWLLRPRGHTGPVTDVALSGDADRIISGSTDQTIRRWRIQGQRLRPDGVLARLDKAVRVVELRPVGNNLVAVGLENGEISLWDPFSARREPLQTLVDNKANRVLSLEFTPDARYLFSSHGSGAVLQWAVGEDLSGLATRSRPVGEREFDFAVYDLAGLGAGQPLAVAGRYSRLLLWHWQDDTLYDLGGPRGSQNDYIQSLAVPDFKPQRLAAADNRGRIRLWDLSQCLPQPSPNCEELLEDWPGHGGAPVRSLAFSANGCYLVSVGDDHRVMLWPLAADGRRASRWQNGQSVRRSRQPLNTVGVVLSADRILVSSGGDDSRVQLDSLKRKQFQPSSQGLCDTP
jgi:WD40 repeat protein